MVFKLFKAYFKSGFAWRLILVVLVQFCLSYLFWGDSSCWSVYQWNIEYSILSTTNKAQSLLHKSWPGTSEPEQATSECTSGRNWC